MKSIVDYLENGSRIGILIEQNPQKYFLALFRSGISLHMDLIYTNVYMST